MKFYDLDGKEIFLQCGTCDGDLTFDRRNDSRVYLICPACNQAYDDLDNEIRDLEDKYSELEDKLTNIQRILY